MKHPVYPKNTDETHLFNELRKRVNQRVQEIPENRDRYIRIKAVILPIVYFGSYFLAVFNGDKPWLYIACYIMMGLTLVLIYLNLIHEAAHNNIYKTKSITSGC